jgi:Uma2 family endonuclease
MAATRDMTTEEYLKTPETVLPQELIYGVIRAAEAPLPRHQAAVADFFRALDAHVGERQLGEMWLSPIDVILDERRALVLQPDLLFISNERRGILTDRIRGAPDMVLEVLSPNPRIGRLDERVGWFAEYGVRECWLLHQSERRLEIVRFAGRAVSERESFDDSMAIRSAVLPDFHLTIGSILRWSA